MEDQLRTYLNSIITKLADDVENDQSTLEYDLNATKDASHGDFATNWAFKASKVLKQAPKSIAESAVELIIKEDESASTSIIEKIEVAGPGFINFFLKKTSLASILLTVLKEDEKYGTSDFGKGKKVLLEYVSANPTGPLTIAHGRQAAVGSALARILKTTGHEVYREFYLNDAGRQMNLLGQSVWARYCEEFQMESEFPEDGYHGDYIKELAQDIIKQKRDELLKDKREDAIEFCGKFAREFLMGAIEEDLASFRVKFDNYFSEKSLYKKNSVEETVKYLQDEKQIYEEEDALWFRSTDYGDDKDRVIKKSNGDYTYLTPDIAYHRTKFDRGNNWLVNLWGPDHHGYITRLKAACQALGHQSNEIDIRIVQLTTLYRSGKPVRMSTRAGEFVTLKELMDEVGVDAARFFFIMRRVESPLDFDLDLAKEKSQDNPVYYLQYAHARISGILNYSEKKLDLNSVSLELLKEQNEIDLMKRISEYPKFLTQASEMLEPYRLADYLRDLATAFHKFYSHHRVVTEDEALTQSRLLLCNAVRIVLRNGLELLGISQPTAM